MAEARLRTLLIIVLSVVFWAGLFGLFYFGFECLVGPGWEVGSEYHARAVEFVFHLFFASLNVMLVFSAGIILYGALFASDETRFLLTTPLRPERVVLHHFQEALLFSSWGFFLLASPLTLAYGISVGAPWHFYLLVTPLIVAFVYIPCSVGAVACLLLIHKLAHVRLTVVALLAAAAVGAAVAAVWETFRLPTDEFYSGEFLDTTMRGFSMTREEWLPSSWLSDALIDAARPTPEYQTTFRDTPVVRALANLMLLTANALMGRLILILVAARSLRPGFSQLECRPRRPRRSRLALVDRLANAALAPFPTHVRLLLVKDWRVLRRDPVQWSQFLIFFGLLGLYFLNVDRFGYATSDIDRATWVNLVSFLNLSVVGLILSTFTTRFIFPMLSLEGRRFWVLGLLPVSRRTIVWSKFVFAALGSWGPCAALVLASDLVLGVHPLVVGMHQLTMLLLSLGLAALAVGLGASMPDFRETSPSKIAAGFGGTLTLVLSAAYIVGVLLLAAMPAHLWVIADTASFESVYLGTPYLRGGFWFGLLGAVAFGATATAAPLWQGVRAFDRLEFR
ncbi:MAG: hypothetical protein AAF805_04780 [Planctomycetota bacterium]